MFLRHLFYEFSGGYKKFAGPYDAGLYKQTATATLVQLARMNRGIYRLPNTTTPYFPANQTLVDNLFASGDICITHSYDPNHAGQMIHLDQDPRISNWPNSTRAWIPKSGTIGNVNFLAIAGSAPQAKKAAAMVVADIAGSWGAMYSRRSNKVPGGDRGTPGLRQGRRGQRRLGRGV